MNDAPKKKTSKKWKRRLKRAGILFVILVILAGAGWYGWNSLKQEYTVVYDGYTATIGSISNSLSFSGSLNLVDSATYSTSSSTTVRNVYVTVGDDVKEGDKLIRLANGTTVEAEFDGRINALNVEAGEEVSANTNLVQVADFTHMMVSIRVDEYDISDVSIGQACTVTTTATEKSFESEIAAIDYISASGGNVAYYTATAYVDVDEGIYPGMQATVTIPQEQAENVVVLKMDALSFDVNNSAYVWMYNDEQVLEQVSVEVGVSNGNYVEIVSGLSEGDEVYVEAEVETSASGVSGLLSGLFGGNQMNMPSGGMGNGNMRDFSSGSMPDFSSGNMPNFGGGNSGNNSGNRGNTGGGQ